MLLLLALHMLTLRFMVADFCSLVILIHNTLLGEIINYKENYSPIPQYAMRHFHIQRFKFIDFMVIELR